MTPPDLSETIDSVDTVDTVDVRGFPRLERYLDELPEGLNSYYGARAKASVVRKVYAFSARPLIGLPPQLQQLLDNPPPPTAWVPQAHALALIVAMVEARQLAPDDEQLWIRAAASELFASPMYKVLMWAASPRMVFKSAKIRWSAFFRGTSLNSEVQAMHATVTLRAPRHLFNEDLARIFEQVIYAAVNYTRDAEAAATLRLAAYRPDHIEYIGEW